MHRVNAILSFRSGFSTSWFRAVEDSAQEQYGRICTRMILFCISLAVGGSECYSRQISPAQKLATDQYVAALGSGEKNEAQALQQLLKSLFTQDRRRFARRDWTVYRFLILHSFREQGHLAKASVITQFISAIVFFGRGTIFKAIRRSMKHSDSGFFTWVVWIYHHSTQAQPHGV